MVGVGERDTRLSDCGTQSRDSREVSSSTVAVVCKDSDVGLQILPPPPTGANRQVRVSEQVGVREEEREHVQIASSPHHTICVSRCNLSRVG